MMDSCFESVKLCWEQLSSASQLVDYPAGPEYERDAAPARRWARVKYEKIGSARYPGAELGLDAVLEYYNGEGGSIAHIWKDEIERCNIV